MSLVEALSNDENTILPVGAAAASTVPGADSAIIDPIVTSEAAVSL
jgi:hypothetical protein